MARCVGRPGGPDRKDTVTTKSDFTEQEWEVVREGPPIAGMIAATASSGGSFRESWAMAKSFAEARQHHGESELLDALVAEKPRVKHYSSSQELEQQGLERGLPALHARRCLTCRRGSHGRRRADPRSGARGDRHDRSDGELELTARLRSRTGAVERFAGSMCECQEP